MDKLVSNGAKYLRHSLDTVVNTTNNPLLKKSTKPDTLRNLSIIFVTKHIEAVESLENFPSDIALEIFNRCIDEKFKGFLNWTEQSTTLELFVKAYPDEFLTSCKLTCFNTINELDFQMPFLVQALKKLDISGCGLGDEHDILPLLKKCCRLESLCLANNELTYKGLRTVFGIKTTVSMNLEYLDISDNFCITHIGLTRYVIPLKSIKKIIVSIKICDIDEWNTKLQSYKFGVQKVMADKREQIVNQGWASELIDNWQKFKRIDKHPLANKKSSYNNERLDKRKLAQHFYSRKGIDQRTREEKRELPKTSNSEYGTFLCERVLHITSYPDTSKRRKVSNDNEEYLSILSMYE